MCQLLKEHHRWKLALSEAEQIPLQEGLRHHQSPQVRERCAALLTIAQGRSPHFVARHALLVPRDPESVYQWISWYQQEGLVGLLAHQHGGARRGPL